MPSMRELSKEDIRDKLSMILSSIVILEQRTVGINSGLDWKYIERASN